MQQKDIEEWRLAERAAVHAEQAAREAAGARSDDHRELAAAAKQRRAYADRLWREFLGSSLAPLTSLPAELPAPEPVRNDAADTATLTRRIDEWRRAQARAHAAEVKAVHAYSRFVQGVDEEAPYAWQAEAMMLREESAARLQRVYDEANRLRTDTGRHTSPRRS